jgi:predicted ABC-type ATPase
VKDLVILGGPNGAGKTTAAQRLLPAELNIREFVNADEIARGLSPFNPEGSAVLAGRLMIRRIRDLAKSGESFAFETTCAGRSHLRLLRECRDLGYRLMLIFLWLESAEVAVARVSGRVQEGGHSVPTGVIVRRYHAGLRNMRRLYLSAVDTAYIYDNTAVMEQPIAERQPGGHLTIHDATRWATIEQATQ